MNRAFMDFNQIKDIADDNQRRVTTALSASRIGVFEYEPQNDRAFGDAGMPEFWGWSRDEAMTFEKATSQIYPDDREDHDRNYQAVLDPGGDRHMDMESRVFLRGGGPMRWVHARADCSFENGLPVRLIGTVQDVTERSAAEERANVLVHELEHRVKNTLSTVLSLINLSRRGHDHLDDYIDALQDRMFALLHAHDALRRNKLHPVGLQELIDLQVRDILGKEETRITVTGPDIMISAQHVLTFSMAVYELFTNAMKYGALAQSGGRMQVACFADDHTSGFSWHEKPGAFLPEAANPAGFGSLLLMTMLPRELNGSTEMDLTREGLRFTLSMPASEGAK